MDDKTKRKEATSSALAINSLGGNDLSEYAKKLLEDYIEGKSTPEENVEKLKEHYKKLAIKILIENEKVVDKIIQKI